MCISRSVIGAKPLVCAFSVIYKCLLTWKKHEFVEFFSLSTSLWRVKLYYFPSLSSLLPPLNSQHPCTTPPPKTMVASCLDEMAIFLADIQNSSQAACFQFYLPWFCLCTSFLALRDVWPPAQLSFHHLCLFALAAPQGSHSPIQSTWQTLSIPQDPAEMLPVSICLSASFSAQFISPTSPPIHGPFKWQHYSHCAIANAHSPTVATLCSKDDAFIVYVVLASDMQWTPNESLSRWVKPCVHVCKRGHAGPDEISVIFLSVTFNLENTEKKKPERRKWNWPITSPRDRINCIVYIFRVKAYFKRGLWFLTLENYLHAKQMILILDFAISFVSSRRVIVLFMVITSQEEVKREIRGVCFIHLLESVGYG